MHWTQLGVQPPASTMVTAAVSVSGPCSSSSLAPSQLPMPGKAAPAPSTRSCISGYEPRASSTPLGACRPQRPGEARECCGPGYGQSSRGDQANPSLSAGNAAEHSLSKSPFHRLKKAPGSPPSSAKLNKPPPNTLPQAEGFLQKGQRTRDSMESRGSVLQTKACTTGWAAGERPKTASYGQAPESGRACSAPGRAQLGWPEGCLPGSHCSRTKWLPCSPRQWEAEPNLPGEAKLMCGMAGVCLISHPPLGHLPRYTAAPIQLPGR